jgi:hypothetical protein
MDSDNANGGSPLHSSKTTLQTLQSSSDGPRLDSNHLDDVRESIRESVQASHGPTINASPATHGNTGPESKLVKNKNVKLERTSNSKVRQPPDGAIGDYGTLNATKKYQEGACGTKRTVDHAEPSFQKRQCIPGTEHSINCKRFGLERFTTPAFQRKEAASKKQEATRQAQVEEEWAEAEKRAQNLEERIKWAITKPPNIEKQPGLTIGTQKKNAAKAEKQWGNSMIGQTDNGNWSTLVGERLVYDILELRGESPRKVERKGGFEPDWETDNFIYEVKTSNWWVDGSAGEKVLGTWIKYQSIPELYGKPLRIICVANQEHELQYGKIKYFGPDVSTKTKQALELARSWGIEYITFSDLAMYIV